MRVLVTGYTGQLGYDVAEELKRRGIDYAAPTRNEFDLRDEASVQKFILSYTPDAVIHCAAYTAVDQAEDDPELCFAVNEMGTKYIAKACKEISAKLMYISTDYIFAGDGDEFYETNDVPVPQNVYGKSKLAGELAIKAILNSYFIVRISWVFGSNGNNFINAMLRLGKERTALNVVADQFGSPTYTADLAPLLCEIIQTEKYGTYHATNEGVCSWAEFAQEIFRQAKYPARVEPIPATAYPTKAKRPQNSRMSKNSLSAAGFRRLPSWQDAVRRYVGEMKSH